MEPDQKINEKNRNEILVDINLINFIISKPSKIHQTGDEDQAMQKALSMSLESHLSLRCRLDKFFCGGFVM